MPAGRIGHLGELQAAHQRPGFNPFLQPGESIRHESTLKAKNRVEERGMQREEREARVERRHSRHAERAAEREERAALRAQNQGGDQGDRDAHAARGARNSGGGGMISRAQARAAVAKAREYAAGSREWTGEDLEEINRQRQAEARATNEAQQANYRRSGGMGSFAHGGFAMGMGGTPANPHGGSHEYIG